MTKSVYDSNDDGKVAAADAADTVPWAGVASKPATYPPSTHGHTQADVTNLVAELAGKEAAGTAAAAVAAHAGLSDPHAGYQQEAEKGQANGYASLGADGKVPAAQLPASGGGPLFAGATAADINTGANTTPVDLTGLVFSYVQNSVYQILLAGATRAAATTTGNRFAFNVSGAVTRVGIMGVQQLANTGTVTGHQSIADDASVGLTSARPTVNVDTAYLGLGYLVTGAGQSGTCQLRFISETTAVATCMAGFTMTVFKVV